MQRIFYLLFFSILLSFRIQAQKPNPVSPLEIALPPENETFSYTGNMRVLQRTGFPVAIYQTAFRVTPAAPETMAREYLMQNRAVLGLQPEDIGRLRLHHVRQSATGTTVRLRQYWNNLPVNNNAEITIHIDPSSKVNFVMNGFRYNINLQNTTPAIDATTARQTVFQHLGITGSLSADKNELMVLNHSGNNYLVYRVVLATDQPVGEWEAYVNAQTGALMKVEDKAAYHKTKRRPVNPRPPFRIPMRLDPAGIQVNGTATVFDPDPLTTALAAYGGSYVDGSDANAAVLTAQLKNVTLNDITLTAGTYSLVGPYAEIRDFEAPSKGLFTQASSTFNFDRNADNFEAVNTYYHIDAMMRYLNLTLGLSIMPYQYAGGVRFDPSGLSGADNSHYLSSNGQLAFGEGGVDDAEDADVIIHELGHGLHDWITAGGLSQVNGLSEGTGDYIAASYSRSKGFWTSAQAAYFWTFNWDGHNPFWGGRVLNYAPVYPGGLVNQIHTDGQIWATANMKIWDDIGRQKTDKVFWSGLDATNSASSQNDAANAVYSAASALGYTNAERLAIHTRYTAAGYTLPAFVLPVQLTAFSAVKNGSAVQVKWTTAIEVNSRSFTIERSADGVNFSALGIVLPAGNAQVPKNYVFNDVAPLPGKNYYRLKETAVDGVETYSVIAIVNFAQKGMLEVYPNPVTQTATLKTNEQRGTVYVYNTTGRLVKTQVFTQNGATGSLVTLNLETLPAGVYSIKLAGSNGVLNGKFIKE